MDADPALKYVFDEWDKTLAAYPAAKEKFNEASAAAKQAGRTLPRPPAGPGHQNTPGGLYNAMIAPLTPYAIRGVIWYQGESNASPTHALPYRRLFRTMIEDWRAKWDQGSFPFLFVQLANFKANPSWPVLRESQTETLELRNTGMAVTIDIGESGNIHPRNKQEVGRRLLLAARAVAYGERAGLRGPAVPAGHARRQSTARLVRFRRGAAHARWRASRGIRNRGAGRQLRRRPKRRSTAKRWWFRAPRSQRSGGGALRLGGRSRCATW